MAATATHRRRVLTSLVCLSAMAFPFSSYSGGTAYNFGFDDKAWAEQQSLEQMFDENINVDEMREWLRDFSRRPHHVGSRAGGEYAEQIESLFKSWGYDVTIEKFDILFPTPSERIVELLEPSQFVAELQEASIIEDPSTSVREGLLPPYNAFSIDGEVVGELVYVNYGRPEDYELLDRYGVDVTGKIVIAKYGKVWRGIKPKYAAERGAAGAIIYSDPADDGFGQGDTYPDGPYKHATGVQRGSVMDMPTYPGDVLTPGVGATKGTRRLKLQDVSTITKIPVLPISYSDAMPLLTAIRGPVVPESWRGALPIAYHLGPGPAVVRLKVSSNWNRVSALNVVARLEGAKFPNEWVIRGNHHDAWNHGAADPISGLAAMLAEAKSVAQLVANHGRPDRTIVYAAWDAEEPGLIGSTEWAEFHARELQEKAVAYINTDVAGRGFVNIGGSHSLEAFMNDVSDDVQDPQFEVSLKERRRAHIVMEAKSTEDAYELRDRENIRLRALGSGTDYTSFLHHLGIPSVDIYFDGESPDGSYHTLYDTYEHYITWRDPGFAYGVALSRLAGRATLRLANAQLLPFEFVGLADNVEYFVDDLEELSESMRAESKFINTMIDDDMYALSLDPSDGIRPPERQPNVPFFNFAPLRNAVAQLRDAAVEYRKASANVTNIRSLIARDRLETANMLLYSAERLLTRKEGHVNRRWYKHYLYAPGFYTGYGVKTIPGVRESIESRYFDQVDAQIESVAELLEDLTARILHLTEYVREK